MQRIGGTDLVANQCIFNRGLYCRTYQWNVIDRQCWSLIKSESDAAASSRKASNEYSNI